MDSDDYFSLECVQKCVELVCAHKTEIDLIFYESLNFFDKAYDADEELCCEGFLRFYKHIQEGKVYFALQILEEHIQGNYLAFSVGCQIKFEMIKNLRFFEGIMAEDALFAPTILAQARFVSFIKSTFYHRRIRPLSITDFGDQHTKETLPASLGDIYQVINNVKDAKVYYLAYSSACICCELYLHFFVNNQYEKGVLEKVNDLILDRIAMAFEALHFEADPRNARAKLFVLKSYLPVLRLSSKIAYFFPNLFRILKKIKISIKVLVNQ